VEGHEVGALEQFLERHPAAAARGEELAAETLEAAADSVPDPAIADDADGRPVQVPTQHQPRVPGGPLAAAHERLSLGEPARDAEHQRQRKVRR